MRLYKRLSFALNVVSAVESTVTTHAVLGSLVTESGTAYNVSFNYMAKDVVSNLGSMMIITRAAKMADRTPVRAMYVSQTTYQAALVVECLSAHIPTYAFIPAVGFAGIGKTIAWTAIGAMNAKMIANMGHSNAGENYAKLAVINTLANSIGTGLGLAVILHPSHLLTLPFLTITRVLILRAMVAEIVKTDHALNTPQV